MQSIAMYDATPPAAKHMGQAAGLTRLQRVWPRLALIVVGAVLAGQAAYLIDQGIRQFGVYLPLGLGIFMWYLALDWPRLQTRKRHSLGFTFFWYGAWTAFWLWLLSFLLFAHFLVGKMKEDHVSTVAPKAILVLGSGVYKLEVSPVLKARLDVSAVWAKRYPDALILLSGGKRMGGEYSEAEVMRHYLQNNLQLSNRIALEDESHSTQANFQNSIGVLRAHGVAKTDPIAVVSSDFHLLRAQKMAEAQGYTQTSYVPAATPEYVRYNNWLREYFTYISAYVLGEI